MIGSETGGAPKASGRQGPNGSSSHNEAADNESTSSRTIGEATVTSAAGAPLRQTDTNSSSKNSSDNRKYNFRDRANNRGNWGSDRSSRFGNSCVAGIKEKDQNFGGTHCSRRSGGSSIPPWRQSGKCMHEGDATDDALIIHPLSHICGHIRSTHGISNITKISRTHMGTRVGFRSYSSAPTAGNAAAAMTAFTAGSPKTHPRKTNAYCAAGSLPLPIYRTVSETHLRNRGAPQSSPESSPGSDSQHRARAPRSAAASAQQRPIQGTVVNRGHTSDRSTPSANSGSTGGRVAAVRLHAESTPAVMPEEEGSLVSACSSGERDASNSNGSQSGGSCRRRRSSSDDIGMLKKNSSLSYRSGETQDGASAEGAAGAVATCDCRRGGQTVSCRDSRERETTAHSGRAVSLQRQPITPATGHHLVKPPMHPAHASGPRRSSSAGVQQCHVVSKHQEEYSKHTEDSIDKVLRHGRQHVSDAAADDADVASVAQARSLSLPLGEGPQSHVLKDRYLQQQQLLLQLECVTIAYPASPRAQQQQLQLIHERAKGLAIRKQGALAPRTLCTDGYAEQLLSAHYDALLDEGKISGRVVWQCEEPLKEGMHFARDSELFLKCVALFLMLQLRGPPLLRSLSSKATRCSLLLLRLGNGFYGQCEKDALFPMLAMAEREVPLQQQRQAVAAWWSCKMHATAHCSSVAAKKVVQVRRLEHPTAFIQPRSSNDSTSELISLLAPFAEPLARSGPPFAMRAILQNLAAADVGLPSLKGVLGPDELAAVLRAWSQREKGAGAPLKPLGYYPVFASFDYDGQRLTFSRRALHGISSDEATKLVEG
ncbi:hypothetical protein cyc_05403 [Cyclospora cayetanensis]|uniref:Uncharacterized protein n=1 Tax=Cyclospora cayetanensis TaxID=88456 RepID=A0A1D3D6C0_9EIME|nr:hypothetical protein cyc_05403 [Cyclospora cayetanensis]